MNKLIILAVLIPFIFSCNDDESVQVPELNKRFEGKWNMIQNICYCFDTFPREFDVNDHIWSFDKYATKMEVTNNVTHQNQYYSNGSYDIVILNDDSLTIGIYRMFPAIYRYRFTDSTLIIALPNVDANHFILVR
jgi:hypothetical protein